MRFILEPTDQENTIQHYRCAPWTIDIMAFLCGQYRIQIWYDGPKGTKWRWPDMIQPNF